MICDECEKCWLNYIEDCGGLDVFKKDKCKKVIIKEDFEKTSTKEKLKNIS